MTRGDARALAEKLMARHGLTGWRFDFDHARRRLGCCDYRNRRITISRHLVALNDDAQVRDTLLHEIAHALTPGDGHGARWRAACKRVGARPVRCAAAEDVVLPVAPHALVCDACGQRYPRYRRSRTTYLCGHCPREGRRASILRWEARAVADRSRRH